MFIRRGSDIYLPFSKHFLAAYHVPSTLLDHGNIAVNKTRKSCFYGAYILVGEIVNKNKSCQEVTSTVKKKEVCLQDSEASRRERAERQGSLSQAALPHS